MAGCRREEDFPRTFVFGLADLPVDCPATWPVFLGFADDHATGWGVQRWCTSMELVSLARHIHLMLQFHSASNARDVSSFCFSACRPNASATDLCGEGQCKKKLRQSIDRAFFYVFADKLGTIRGEDGKVCAAGNYLPCWTTRKMKYQVLGNGQKLYSNNAENLRRTYEELLFLTQDLQACQAGSPKEAGRRAVQDRVKRIRSNPEIYRPFPEIPLVCEWLNLFSQDALRYHILTVLGAGRAPAPGLTLFGLQPKGSSTKDGLVGRRSHKVCSWLQGLPRRTRSQACETYEHADLRSGAGAGAGGGSRGRGRRKCLAA